MFWGNKTTATVLIFVDKVFYLFFTVDYLQEWKLQPVLKKKTKQINKKGFKKNRNDMDVSQYSLNWEVCHYEPFFLKKLKQETSTQNQRLKQ